MKRVHPAAQAGKRTTTIIAIILISALAVTGAAITHGLGMWGTKPATVATSASTKTGSLDAVTSLAGNVSRVKGGVLSFAVIVNDPENQWSAIEAINVMAAKLAKL